jgi:hypothetical protein
LNDPYLGGNHLPDITLVSPVFLTAAAGDGAPSFFVASRAHHADVGGMSPGSMPLSTELYQEGIIIPPIRLVDGGKRNEAVWRLILRNVRTPDEREGDLAAQLAAHAIGALRLEEIVQRYGLDETFEHALALLEYARRLTRAAVAKIPDGRYTFCDALDNDGQTEDALPLKVTVEIEPIMTSITISRPVEVEGLGFGLYAYPSPEQVSVILSGPAAILDTLSPEDVRVFVDAGALPVGTHMLEPQVTDVPEDVTYGPPNPPVVEVTITFSPRPTSTPVPAS